MPSRHGFCQASRREGLSSSALRLDGAIPFLSSVCTGLGFLEFPQIKDTVLLFPQVGWRAWGGTAGEKSSQVG